MPTFSILRSFFLACCILGTSCSRAPERPKWTVTVEQSGNTISEEFYIPEDGATFENQMMAVLQHHMQLSPSGESSRIGISRETENQISDKTKNRLNPTNDNRVSITSSTKQSIGPFYATTRPDGRLQLYQNGSQDRPELLVDGAMTIEDIRRWTAFYFREHLAFDYPEIANPKPSGKHNNGEQVGTSNGG